MKKIIAMVLAVAFTVSVMPVSAAVEASLDNFKKINTYTDEQFSDVTTNDWYADGVKTAFEHDLMKGNNNKFNPSENITYGELIAIASRIHNIYNGGDGNFVQGTPWYQVYIDYAATNHIIDSSNLDETTINNEAARYTFAEIIAKIIDKNDLTPINRITAIPYVDPEKDAKIYILYNAGILTGIDEFGNFDSYGKIKRSEVATILGRIINEELRISFSLPTVPVYSLATTGAWEIDIGETAKREVFISPFNAVDKTIVWTSSNPSVATVDSEGNITGHKAGTAWITATAKNGLKEAVASSSVTVTNNIAVQNIQSQGVNAKKEFTYDSLKEIGITCTKALNAATSMLKNLEQAMVKPFDNEYVYIYCIKAQTDASEVQKHLNSALNQLEQHIEIKLDSGKTLLSFGREIYDLFGEIVKTDITVNNAATKLPKLYLATIQAGEFFSNFNEILIDATETILGI